MCSTPKIPKVPPQQVVTPVEPVKALQIPGAAPKVAPNTLSALRIAGRQSK